MNDYTLGTQIQFTATVKNLAGALVDAATATVTVKAPDGTVTTTTPTHASTGVYTYVYEPTMSKTHAVRIVTTNPDSAAESQIWVLPSLVA